MNFNKILLTIALIFAISLNSCKKDDTVIDPNNQLGGNTIAGIVKDANGANLSGVTVSVGANSTISDMNGKFTLTKVAKGEKVKVNFSKSGFVSTQKLTKVMDNKAFYINASLAQITKTTTITNSGGDVEFNGAIVSFPANAFVDSIGNPINSPVSVNATYFDPTIKEFYNMFPGEFEGKRTDGSITMIESFGFVDIELMLGTEKVNLAPGKEATIKLNLPSAISGKAPSTIPLWYFDTNQGIWIEEGTATKQGDSYIGKVKHFSPWNYDQPILPSFIEGKVKDQNGKALNGARVKAEGVDYSGSSIAYTDEYGNYKLPVKENGIANVYASLGGFESLVQKVNFLPVNQVLKIDDLVITFEVIVKNGWYNQISGTSQALYDVFFIDENEGWVLGDDSILHTIDGGINWNPIGKDKFGVSRGKIYFQTNKIGWIVGSNVSAYLLKTTDGGYTWNVAFRSDSADNYKIIFLDINNGYLLGNIIYKTSDGGNTWFKLDNMNGIYTMRHGFVFSKDNLIIYNFDDKYAYKTTDAGKTWSAGKLLKADIYGFEVLDFVSPSVGFWGGINIYKTIDGGLNWTFVFAPSKNEYIYKFHFKTLSIGWAIVRENIGGDCRILYTSDGGSTWIPQKTNNYFEITSIFFVNDKKGWVVGENGTILHTDNGGIE